MCSSLRWLMTTNFLLSPGDVVSGDNDYVKHGDGARNFLSEKG
jgi:hypothetical protein